jgi:hypothetical protein
VLALEALLQTGRAASSECANRNVRKQERAQTGGRGHDEGQVVVALKALLQVDDHVS